MRPRLALALAAAVVVAAGGCCIDAVPDDACVVDRLVQRPYCYEIVHDEYVCWNDADGERPSLRVGGRRCEEGTFHAGDDCSDHGYTLRCGDHWVRPPDRC